MSDAIPQLPMMKVEVIGTPSRPELDPSGARFVRGVLLLKLVIRAGEHLRGAIEKRTGRTALQNAEMDLRVKESDLRLKDATSGKFEIEAELARQQLVEFWIGLLEPLLNADYLSDETRARLIEDMVVNNPKAPAALKTMLKVMATSRVPKAAESM